MTTIVDDILSPMVDLLGQPWFTKSMITVPQLRKYFGSSAEIGRICGVSREAVRRWKRVPPEHAHKISTASKGKWSRNDLCPDFPWGDVSDVSSKEAA